MQLVLIDFYLLLNYIAVCIFIVLLLITDLRNRLKKWKYEIEEFDGNPNGIAWPKTALILANRKNLCTPILLNQICTDQKCNV